jgi:hypothetical protein
MPHCWIDSMVASVALFCERTFRHQPVVEPDIAFTDEWERTYMLREFDSR